jgi:2-polyprenyl-6-methoxyphenol hydroxylase-like FAD-dependent oxidoreductase
MIDVVSRVLIGGGGFSGLAAAIAFRQRGVSVDLVERQSANTTYGAGISIGGPTLRALKSLGVLDRYLAEGYACDGTEIRLPHGQVIQTIPTPRVAGPDVPGNGAVMRPVLAAILHDAAVAAGAHLRFGTALSEVDPAPYDLVVCAEGLHSETRHRLFPHAPAPVYRGQGVWRAVLPRLPEVEHTILWVSENLKVGVNPVSRQAMYLFVNENSPAPRRVEAAGSTSELRGLLAAFPDPLVQAMREAIAAGSHILYRPIEQLLLPLPWHSGNTVLIGDAVHATTPHLAAGAGIGIEDAIVLADECARGDTVEVALNAFEARRWDRCRMVVENSAQLGDIETSHGDKAEHARVMARSFAALCEEI